MPINFRQYANIQAYPYPGFPKSARVRARQNLKLLKITYKQFEYEPGHLEHFKISRPYVSARVLCARTARGKVKIQIFAWFGFLLP